MDEGEAEARRVSPPAGAGKSNHGAYQATRQTIKEWIPDDEPNLTWFNQERKPVGDDSRQYDQSPAWRPTEILPGDGRTLVLEDS